MTERLRPALQVVLHDLIDEVTPDDLTEPELLTFIAILTSARDRVRGIAVDPGPPGMTTRLQVVPASEGVETAQQLACEHIIREVGS